ncbi:MAG TPA: sigma-70 family RNA polymerase sigma factor [Solirubrobacteraceae bacterium]|nr:sigma-70 family RNA polymerase sigma factor [Solirubrobacteraceae bacterium]
MPLLRFRSDDQLVALFRAGHDEAFRAIHERYHKRLFAYARQMLPGRQDAEDALQDVFVRAYAGLRASDQELALRAWLFRVAHNRCIDELRRPAPPPPELLQLVRTTVHDPLAEVDLRESLRRLVEDIRRLPEQQRSALLMRELVGMSYADLSVSLGISIGAVKSLLVRARVALAQAAEARDTSCLLIREQLVEAHDRGIRPNATARKHMRDCVGCKSFRRELRGMSRQLAAVSPIVGPLGILAKLGFSGGAGGGAAGGGGLALLGGGGAASASGAALGVNHLATLLVAAVATAGGAVELQHTIISPSHHPAGAGTVAHHRHRAAARPAPDRPTGIQVVVGAVEATVATAPALASDQAAPVVPVRPKVHHKPTAGGAGLSPSSGASALINSSKSGSTSLTGTGTATGTSSSTSAACSVPAGSTSTATTTASSAAPSTASHTATDTSAPASTSTSTSTSTSSTGSTASATSTPTATSCTPAVTPATSGATTTGSGSATTPASDGTAGTSTGSSSGSGSVSGTTSTGSSGGSASVGS